MSEQRAIQEIIEHRFSRRRILRYLMGFTVTSTLVGILTPIIGYLWPPARQGGTGGGLTLVGSLEDFPPDRGRIVPVRGKPVIVVNTGQGIRAFSAICTHLGCIVLEKEPGTPYIQCPCHDGRFNPVDGSVMAGPPPRGLPPYEVTVEDNKVYVGKPLGELFGG